ncbi:MAG: hypothetical protein H9535_00905 [Ignavibacteria bacterium]|nr:hypothetical protein [Ignavibacteria bacterium]
MAIIIDVRPCSPGNNAYTKELCRSLHCEAFFVDTNVLIDFKDPLGRALDKKDIERKEFVTDALTAIKSQGVASYSTLTVSIEYYKYIQTGFYQTFANQKITTLDFKRLRETSPGFAEGWALHVRKFRETFAKKFPLYGETQANVDIRGMTEEVDFGDFALYDTVRRLTPTHRFVFSNDGDFYSFSDILLFTVNPTMIEKARKDNLLFVQ